MSELVWRIFLSYFCLGADQLAAAKLCYVYAKQWRDTEKSEKADSGFQKVMSNSGVEDR